VTDTGIGISADRLATVFDRFNQADNSLSRPYGGAGLGLAISHQLVAWLGGTMGAESEPGCGSTFWFEVTLEVADDAPRGPGGSDGANATAITHPSANTSSSCLALSSAASTAR
jgi:hypothetical protein